MENKSIEMVNAPLIASVANIEGKLESLGAEYSPMEDYLFVGKGGYFSEWVLHLSVVLPEFFPLVNKVVPWLIEQDVLFKVAKSFAVADDLLFCRRGVEKLGKLICIYPRTTAQATEIAGRLVVLTAEFKGPAVVTDALVANVLFARCHYQPVSSGFGLSKDRRDNAAINPRDYTMPFQLPRGISWPFPGKPVVADFGQPNFLNDRHKITHVMRSDIKGNIYKGLHWKKGLKVVNCVIKEGREHMWSDQAGRTIKDRLLWQAEVASRLAPEVPIPAVLETFDVNGRSYMSIEFIEGETLELYSSRILAGKKWKDCPKGDRQALLVCVSRLLEIVSAVHIKGFVIPDIHPGNIIFGKGGELYLLDLELAYDTQRNRPSPPFRLGTPNFMSPEQRLAAPRPSTAEDIFALGSTLVATFTGLLPGKFEMNKPEIIRRQLINFIPSKKFVDLVAECFQADPRRRPTLARMTEVFQESQEELLAVTPGNSNGNKVRVTNVSEIIRSGVQGMTAPPIRDPRGLWLSRSVRDPRFNHYQVTESVLYPGLAVGAAGPCYVLSRIQQSSYRARVYSPALHSALESLESGQWTLPGNSIGSYFYGMPGLGVAVAEAIRAGEIDSGTSNTDFLPYLMRNEPDDPGAAVGLAGRGIAALLLDSFLEGSFVDELIEKIQGRLFAEQQPTGGWGHFSKSDPTKMSDLGFSNGSSGILYFLICSLERKRDKRCEESVQKGLNYMMGRVSSGNWVIPFLYRQKPKVIDLSFLTGLVGPLLALLRGWCYFGDGKYRACVEKAIPMTKAIKISLDLTLGTGLIGLGELLLEAKDTFRTSAYDNQIENLVGLLSDHYRENPTGGKYWNVGIEEYSTGDLLTGNAGILHFLLRYSQPGSFSFPLLVKRPI